MSGETERQPKPHAAANGCRVLVVDDDADNVGMLVDLLRVEGYSASSAENGAAALALLSEGFDPDLILTDLMMPVMSGWDFCESLKQAAHYRSIPIIVTCGLTPDQRGQLQVEAAFEKPIKVEPLLQKIKELCGL
ncbi:MAG TPA: response regulator [Polyangiaceae bacterium]|nr:response regulator [Polyangiaceae bacterium]